MNIKKSIGKRIKELRKVRHLSQEQLAEKIDINQNALSYIETGENFFSAETLEKLINALQVEPSELFEVKHFQKDEELIEEIDERENPDKIKDIYKITRSLVL